MSQEEDYSKPRNLAQSLFRDDLGEMELPEVSKMTIKNKPGTKNAPLKQSKYQQEVDDDFLNMELTPDSTFVPKNQNHSASSSTNSSKSQKNQETVATKTVKNVGSRIQRRGKKIEQPVKKQEVDIDRQIGEIAEWAERGAKNNSDQEDFNDDNEPQRGGESEQQLQIRKKIEEKLKNGFNGDKQGGGGLRAKAEQLKKENANKLKLPQITEQPSNVSSANEKKPSKKQIERQLEKKQETDHNNSGIQLFQKKQQQKGPQIKEQDEQDIDNHWNNVNKNTINQIAQIQQKRKTMNIQSVINYYQKEFSFDEEDIDDELVGNVKKSVEEDEEEEGGFFDMLCACFKTPKKSKEVKHNVALARRLVAISKKQLSNVEEEFFLLKEIWVRLTAKEFVRHGMHWNTIGFQGRDPATDLRSTGVLSLLQWLQFIEAHSKLASKYYTWSIEHDFPLALTFIKTTGAFLDLLADGMIRCANWSDFQRSFNSLALGMFQKMMEKYKVGDALGNYVEQQAKQIKKQYKKLIASYDQEFKNMK